MSWRQADKPSRESSNTADNTARLRFLSVVFIAVAALIVGRLFFLQIVRGQFYQAMAADQHELYSKLIPERGSIYVAEQNGQNETLFPIVTNQPLYLLYAVPNEIEDSTTTAEKIFALIGLPNSENAPVAAEATSTAQSATSTAEMKKQELLGKWIGAFNQKDRMYYPLRDKLTDAQMKAIQSLDLKGLGFSEKSYRYYTEKGLGGNIFGFYGYKGDDRVGQYGLEGYYEQLLAGQSGLSQSERDAKGNLIAAGSNIFGEKIDGADLVLTINRAIQFKACEALKNSISVHRARSGSIVVMDPATGAVIAMCSQPDFDPANYGETEDAAAFNNQAIFSPYEPGSIFKPITMAAAIDAGAVSANTAYVDTGVVDYKDYKIRNYNDKSYGLSTMTNVLENSINTGVIFAMRQMTPKAFVEYVKKFGFGELTGIDLNKESSGNIQNLSKKGEINQATATFGQGITATTLQMASAYCALVNGGKLMKPYVVSKVIRDNSVIRYNKPQSVKQVISAKTSTIIKGMLVSVIQNGHGKSAAVDGYRVGGKTGTAQIPAKGGGYMSDDEIIGSFAGFAPFDNPRFVIAVRIDQPMEGKLGETVAAPVFHDVMQFALTYYNVPKDK